MANIFPSFFSKPLVKNTLTLLALALLGYYGNQAVQSFFGHRALTSTGLDVYTLDEALAIAQQQNKRVLADMSAIWCPTCRKLDQQVLADDIVKQELQRSYLFARIEYDSPEGEAFMQKYGVRGFPTLLILDSEGNKLSQLPLTFDPKQFLQLLKPTS